MWNRQRRQGRRTGALVAAAAMMGLSGAYTAAAPPGWSDAEMIQPKELATRLTTAKGAKPVLLHVGFPVLFRGTHIPNSIYAGPGGKPEGLENLKKAVAGMPKDKEIVIYCGCCPWSHCPNMKPAMDTLKSLGYTKVKALMIETNMSKDWIQLGYPSEAGSGAN
jgi:rhodanese-related sulfurtransferase